MPSNTPASKCILEKLTPEQEKLIPIIRDNWINRAFSGKDLTIPEIRDGINWMYQKSRKKPPMIFVCDSPFSSQILANVLKKSDLLKRIRKITDTIPQALRNSVGESVRDSVRDSVGASVGASVRDSKLDHETVYDAMDWDAGWMAFYDFFGIIGILKDAEFDKYRELIFSGIWNMILFENVCIVSKLPKSVLKDDRDRLHSVSGAAVTFRDGFSVYAIHGVRFDEKLFNDVSKRKLAPNKLLQLQNTDQRFVAINHYGFEKLIDDLDKTLLDEGRFGNKLYSISFNDVILKALVYPDIDGNGKRVSFVPPELEKADESMAWKHNCTIEEYYRMEVFNSCLI